MRVLLKIILFSVAIYGTGCATNKTIPETKKVQFTESHPQDRMAMVYLYRDQFQGSASPIKVIFDDAVLGTLGGNSYLRLNVEPGSHKIQISFPAMFEDAPSIQLTTGVGEIYYLKHNLKLIKSSIEVVESKKALLEIVNTKHAATLSIKDGFADGNVGWTNVKYQGLPNEPNPNGKGKIIYPTDSLLDSYQGEIVKGKASGKGIMNIRNGAKIEGQFLNGEPISGAYLMSDNSLYEGEMSNWMLNGKGDLFTKNKIRAIGYFKSNKFYSGKIYDKNGQEVAQYSYGKRVSSKDQNQVSHPEESSLSKVLKDIASTSISLLSAISQGYSKNSQKSYDNSLVNSLLNDKSEINTKNLPEVGSYSKKRDSFGSATSNSEGDGMYIINGGIGKDGAQCVKRGNRIDCW